MTSKHKKRTFLRRLGQKIFDSTPELTFDQLPGSSRTSFLSPSQTVSPHASPSGSSSHIVGGSAHYTHWRGQSLTGSDVHSRSPSPAPAGSVILVEEAEGPGYDDLLEDMNSEYKSPNRVGDGVASGLAKTCLCALKESSDAFPPLKSVVAGILFFVDNHEMKKWEANKDTLQRLTLRISRLTNVVHQQLSASQVQAQVSAETRRRGELDRKFARVVKDISDLKKGNRVLRYLMAKDESGILSGIAEDINVAIVDYQLSLQQEMYTQMLSLIRDADMTVLDRLPRAKGASYQSREPNAGCEPQTRVDILNKLESWVINPDPGAQRVYWLNGHAGSGKSTIAHTFCQRLYATGELGASFFSSRDFLERSDIKMIFPTLAFQLACRYPTFCASLVDTLKKHPDLGSESMITQLIELLVKPLQESGISTTICIDALDECKDQEPASTILSLLAKVIDQIPLVRFFVTGRPEAPIRAGFRVPALKPHTEIMVLHEVEQSDVDSDIHLYLNARLSHLASTRSDLDLSLEWPPQDQVKILVAKSAKYFIFASTCVKMISSPSPSDPCKFLEKLTESGSTILEGKGGIDNLYAHVLTNIFSPNFINAEEIKLILGTVILLYNPLSAGSLSDLLKIPRLTTVLGGLHSLVLVPSTKSGRVRVHHKSFPDYLTDRQRCSNSAFYIDPSIYHAEIAIACLEYMSKNLRKNICTLPRYAMNSSIPLDRRRECIGDALVYTCLFWAQHVCNAVHTGEHMGRLLPVLSNFLQQHQILWFEVLSLLDDIHHSVSALRQLEDWLLKIPTNDDLGAVELCLRWIEDGLLLVLRFIECIQVSAWHLYHTALPLAPKSSLLRILHAKDLLCEGTALRGIDGWETQQALRINTRTVPFNLAFSQDGSMLATSTDEAIEVLDVLNGKCLYTLRFDTCADRLNARLSFVANDSMILTGRGDGVELWDLLTGCLIRTYSGFESAGCFFQAVDMSLDGYYIASGDNQGRLRVWKMATGTLVYTANIGVLVYFLSFSPSNKSLIICSKGAVQHRKFLEDVVVQFDCGPHSFADFTISDDRSLLVAFVTVSVSLYDTQTGSVIWTHEFDSPIGAVSILPGKHTLCLSGTSLFQVTVASAASSSEAILEHGLPRFSLNSSVITRGGKYVAYHTSNGSGAYIHHLRSSRPKASSQSESSDTTFPFEMHATADGTMGVAMAMRIGCWTMRLCTADKDVVLAFSKNLSTLWGASLSPNGKFIAILCGSLLEHLILQFWDLDRVSLAFTIYVERRIWNLQTYQFIDDHTFLIVAGSLISNPRFGFSSFPEDTPCERSVYGPFGSSWRLDLPLSKSTDRACLINIEKCSESQFRLEAVAYNSSEPCPRCDLKPLDPQGWLTDKNAKKILWVPHDSRTQNGIGWGRGDIFVTGGNSGVVTAMDFSNVHDLELYDATTAWAEYKKLLAKYVEILEEFDWVESPPEILSCDNETTPLKLDAVSLPNE